MKLLLLAVPYDSALRGFRMGAGPGHLLDWGLEAALRHQGHDVRTETVEADSTMAPAEIRTTFELNRLLAPRVRNASEKGWLPVILSGNCMMSVAAVAGASGSTKRLGVMWFDSHGDFNTPETTIGGFLDGMALAVVTGRCWTQLALSVPGFRAVSESDVVLLGARDIDPLERQQLDASEVTVLPPDRVAAEGADVLLALRRRVQDLYLHLDLDVIEPGEARANAFAAPNGLRIDELGALLAHIAGHFRIRAVSLTAYDPTEDPEGRIPDAAAKLLGALSSR